MSNTLTIHQAKGYISIQDLGRFTAQKLGFSASGAADEYAFLSANKHLGNPPNTPLLEITFGQITFEVSSQCKIILTGANCQPLIKQQALEHWQILTLQPNDVVTLQAPQKGMYTYVGIAGGIQAQKHLNSASTLPAILQTDFSSYNKNTFIFGTQTASDHSNEKTINHQTIEKKLSHSEQKRAQSYYFSHHTSFQNEQGESEKSNNTVRFIPHPLWYEQTNTVKSSIIEQTFTLDSMSNKMGYRLKSQQPIVLTHSSTLSKPVALGAIQVPNDGHPIVLMKDRQTMGGYPTLGNVIQVDIPRLAQLNAHQKIHFTPISLEQAQAQLMAFNEKLNNTNKSYI